MGLNKLTTLDYIGKKWKQFEDWFDLHCGYYLTNGNKVEAREKRLREKFNIQTKKQIDNLDDIEYVSKNIMKGLRVPPSDKDKF